MPSMSLTRANLTNVFCNAFQGMISVFQPYFLFSDVCESFDLVRQVCICTPWLDEFGIRQLAVQMRSLVTCRLRILWGREYLLKI